MRQGRGQELAVKIGSTVLSISQIIAAILFYHHEFLKNDMMCVWYKSTQRQSSLRVSPTPIQQLEVTTRPSSTIAIAGWAFCPFSNDSCSKSIWVVRYSIIAVGSEKSSTAKVHLRLLRQSHQSQLYSPTIHSSVKAKLKQVFLRKCLTDKAHFLLGPAIQFDWLHNILHYHLYISSSSVIQ